MTSPSDPDPIAYATPYAPRPGRVPAAVAITFAGVSVIVVGGCFLIGVMLTLRNGFFAGVGSAPLPGRDVFFLGVLYVCAGACFLGGIALIVIGVSRLLRISTSE